MKQQRSSKGYTLVELAMTVGLMSLTLVAGAPGISGLAQSGKLNSAAEQFAGHMRLARQKAVTEGVSRVVEWAYVDHRYWIVRDENGNGIADADEPREGEFELPGGVTWESPATGGFSGDHLVFESNGSASQTGAVVLYGHNGGEVTLSLLGPTGLVRVR